MKWVKPEIDSGQVRALARLHNIDLLTASILTRRGFTDSERIAYFLEEDERFLRNPFLFPQMEAAVERVLAAAEEEEKVLVFGDRDTDGITATVLMLETLRMAGLQAEWRVPLGNEDYGLNPEVLKAHAAEDFTLVITVDCGISNYDEIELANSLGMDVLIFDHHVPRENQIPNALAIVNPRMPDTYPFTGLCGVAVVSKFQWALTLAQTDIYGEEFCLILAEQAGAASSDKEDEQLVIRALKMRNLREMERVEVSSSEGEIGRNRLMNFIEGCPLLTYNTQQQIPLISGFFSGADVYALDAAEEIGRVFPSLRGRSMEQLKEESRMARYFPSSGGSLGIFFNLVKALQFQSVSSRFDSWRRGLDLVALGTLADLMPLEDENRILVRMGLARLNGSDRLKERRAGLRELLVRRNLHETRVGATELSWQISPIINASGRMGKADAGVSLFLETDSALIPEWAGKLIKMNNERRSLGEKIWEQLKPLAYSSLEELDGKMVIVSSEESPRGITGILASRLLQYFHVPAVVISLQNGKVSGSVRSGEEMNVQHWLKSMEPLLDDFGGHLRAGGFRMKRENLEKLILKTKEWLKEKPESESGETPILIDAELSHQELIRLGKNGLETLLEKLEPYGKDFRPLTFLTRSVQVFSAELMGKPANNHLKLLVSLGENRWPALWWNGAERYGTDIRIDMPVDLVYRIDSDNFRGKNSRRLTILEAAPCLS